MRVRRAIHFGVAVSLATAASSQTSAEIEAAKAETERLKAEKERLAAEKDVITAKADLERTRITSLGLPSFEGKTTLKDGNAAKIEAMMLAADALGGAVKMIKEDAKSGPYLVLAGDEALDFSLQESMELEIEAVHCLLLESLGRGCEAPRPVQGDAPMAVAAISAIAGLLRSETEVSGIDLTASLPNRLLAAAVASEVDGYLPSAMIRSPDKEPEGSLADTWSELLLAAQQAADARKDMGDKPKDKAAAARLDKALARFKTLYDRATTANAQGIAPITAAIRLERLARLKPKILRVYAEYSGGSFVSSKNLATMIGFDPMKVSGGVVVSYTVTDPTTGMPEAHHIISCRSAFTSLRKVQAGTWKRARGSDEKRCEKLI